LFYLPYERNNEEEGSVTDLLKLQMVMAGNSIPLVKFLVTSVLALYSKYADIRVMICCSIPPSKPEYRKRGMIT